MNDIGTLPPNSLAGRGIGDNKPLLPEVLAEELAADRERAAQVLASAKDARIENPADAGKVADLIALCRDMERSLDRDRTVRKAPYLTAQRTVEAAFGQLIGPLARARTDRLAPMLMAWQQTHDEPIATSIAAVGSRREIQFVIEDLPAVLDWLLKHRGGEIAQAARTILGAALRSMGVDAAGDAVIAGVTVTINSKTQVR